MVKLLIVPLALLANVVVIGVIVWVVIHFVHKLW